MAYSGVTLPEEPAPGLDRDNVGGIHSECVDWGRF